jgi:hypothetical protein
MLHIEQKMNYTDAFFGNITLKQTTQSFVIYTHKSEH